MAEERSTESKHQKSHSVFKKTLKDIFSSLWCMRISIRCSFLITVLVTYLRNLVFLSQSMTSHFFTGSKAFSDDGYFILDAFSYVIACFNFYWIIFVSRRRCSSQVSVCVHLLSCIRRTPLSHPLRTLLFPCS